jgi:hypothetical protein
MVSREMLPLASAGSQRRWSLFLREHFGLFRVGDRWGLEGAGLVGIPAYHP